MEEQKQKSDLKKAQMANEWESRTKPQETQQYPAQRMMKEWYEGNFDWRNPRNQYEQTLMEIKESRSRSRSRPRRSGTPIPRRSRSRSRSRSQPQRSGTPTPRGKSRSRSRSRSRPRRRIYAITRAQQKAIENARRQGTMVRPSQIPTNNLRIDAPSPPQQRIRTGSHGQLRGSRFSTPSDTPTSIVISPRRSPTTSSTSTQYSRIYSTPELSGTPRPSERSRSGSRVPSLTPSRQMSRAPSYQSRSSSEQSSRGPQLVPVWRANAGIVINGEINGFRLQVIFSTIHRVDWMTETTAQRCGITGVIFQRDHYLEDTYMDHRFRQQTRNPIDIKIGEDPNQNDLYITTDDRVNIVQDSNFYYRSDSLQDPRNRLFILIGLDTIEDNNLILQLKQLRILFPNPNYQPNPEKKYYKIKAMQYPDLSVQTNREFHVSMVETRKKVRVRPVRDEDLID